jgi:hypothetical protein
LDFSVGELKSVFPVTNYLKQISLWESNCRSARRWFPCLLDYVTI